MGRHTSNRRKNRNSIDNFDRVYMDWPELAHIARVIAMPLKTVYINTACAPWANIDKVIFDVEELQAYLAMWAVW